MTTSARPSQCGDEERSDPRLTVGTVKLGGVQRLDNLLDEGLRAVHLEVSTAFVRCEQCVRSSRLTR